MKAKIQLPACYKKEAEAYIAKLEAESIARVHEEVMKERQDIALRSLYLCLLACYQVGLEPRHPHDDGRDGHPERHERPCHGKVFQLPR